MACVASTTTSNTTATSTKHVTRPRLYDTAKTKHIEKHGQHSRRRCRRKLPLSLSRTAPGSRGHYTRRSAGASEIYPLRYFQELSSARKTETERDTDRQADRQRENGEARAGQGLYFEVLCQLSLQRLLTKPWNTLPLSLRAAWTPARISQCTSSRLSRVFVEFTVGSQTSLAPTGDVGARKPLDIHEKLNTPNKATEGRHPR